MLTIDTNKKQTRWQAHFEKSDLAEAAPGVYYIATASNLEALPGPTLVELWNAYAAANPDERLREVTRFSSHPVAVQRVWGLIVGARARAATGEDEPKEKAPRGRPKREPREKALSKTIRDKEVRAAAKTYVPRPGSKQAFMYDLVSPREGVAVEEFIKRLNATGRWSAYTMSNAWSSLVFNLHTNKGYGLACKDGRFYLRL